MLSAISKRSRSTSSDEPVIGRVRWYTSTDELPLYKFINCLCDDDLSQLVIEGEPKTEDLRHAWFKIYEEFIDGMKDSQNSYKLKLLSKINKLELDYELISLCVKRLSMQYSKEILDIIRRHIRVTGELDPTKPEEYIKALQVIQTRANSTLGGLQEKIAEYKILCDKDRGGEKVTKKHFTSLIAQVQQYTKIQIDKNTMTTDIFIQHYSDMREEAENLSKQMAVGKR